MNLTITMTEAEIVAAIKSAVNATGLVSVGQEVGVNLIASRGPTGHSAVIEIKKELDGPVADFLEQTQEVPETKSETGKTQPSEQDKTKATDTKAPGRSAAAADTKAKSEPKAQPAPVTEKAQPKPEPVQSKPEDVANLFEETGATATATAAEEGIADMNDLPEGEVPQEEPASLFS